MPGTYAHFALINQAQSNRDGLSSLVLNALDTYTHFCDLGAVSPDYPYFQPLGSEGKEWADTLHHEQTVQFVRVGLRMVRDLPEGPYRQKAVAWLWGYASHVIADCIVHPVVNLAVGGSYEDHKPEHRICEMNQDVFIFPAIMGFSAIASEYLKSSVRLCGNADGGLDPTIRDLWEAICQEVHPALYGNASTPLTLDKWHADYLALMDKWQDVLGFLPFARHLEGLRSYTYPREDELDPQYIDMVDTPKTPQPYQEVFNFAVRVVEARWREMDAVLQGTAETCMTDLNEPDMDTGAEVPGGPCVFWEMA